MNSRNQHPWELWARAYTQQLCFLDANRKLNRLRPISTSYHTAVCRENHCFAVPRHEPAEDRNSARAELAAIDAVRLALLGNFQHHHMVLFGRPSSANHPLDRVGVKLR